VIFQQKQLITTSYQDSKLKPFCQLPILQQEMNTYMSKANPLDFIIPDSDPQCHERLQSIDGAPATRRKHYPDDHTNTFNPTRIWITSSAP